MSDHQVPGLIYRDTGCPLLRRGRWSLVGKIKRFHLGFVKFEMLGRHLSGPVKSESNLG